jgi:hypothetical protein
MHCSAKVFSGDNWDRTWELSNTSTPHWTLHLSQNVYVFVAEMEFNAIAEAISPYFVANFN